MQPTISMRENSGVFVRMLMNYCEERKKALQQQERVRWCVDPGACTGFIVMKEEKPLTRGMSDPSKTMRGVPRRSPSERVRICWAITESTYIEEYHQNAAKRPSHHIFNIGYWTIKSQKWMARKGKRSKSHKLDVHEERFARH